ncbi:MAG TPA: MmgE/PrpD family protein [Ilumatobacter sp.]|nr:MmgE/PrpD family protein [Ilumatobacter sp.]
MTRIPLARALASRALGVACEPGDRAVLRLQIADTIGCLVGGATHPLAPVLLAAAGDETIANGTRLLSTGAHVTLSRGVAIDTTLAHVDEFDPIHLAAAVLPTATTLPAALHLGALLGSDGDVTERAVVAGSDALAAVSIALGGGALYERGWWPAAVFAPIGAAVTAGVLLGLDEDHLTAAISLASVSTGGLLAPTHYGAAHYALLGQRSAAGLDAALLARAGADGDHRILDDAAAPALGAGLSGLPEAVGVALVGGCALKPFPCARPLHAAIEGLEALLLEAGNAAVTEVRVGLPGPLLKIVTDNAEPRGQADAAASAPFVVAATLAGVVRDIATFRNPVSSPTDVAIELVRETRLEASFPATWAAEVSIVADGQRRTTVRDRAVGDAATPLGRAGVSRKFLDLVPEPALLERLYQLGGEASIVAVVDDVIEAMPSQRSTTP